MTGALLALAGPSCASQDPPVRHRNFDLILSEPKVAALKRQALAGDGPAAYELFMHYYVGSVDDRQGLLWLRLAYRLHEPRARKVVRMMREDHPDEYRTFTSDSTLPSR